LNQAATDARSRGARLLVVALALACPGPRARADEPAAPRRAARWQQLVAAAKDHLAHDRLADARDDAFDAQRIGDTAETSALLASAIYGLGLVEDDQAQIGHAALMAEKCLQQLAVPDGELDDEQRLAIRVTCLSVAARAYQQLGNNRLAHARAADCAHPPAARAPVARLQLICCRIIRETESQGYGVLGGTWWRYVVVTAQVGYGVRYLSGSRLSSPGGRLDGYDFEGAVGYPNFSVGALLLRPEVFLRFEQLSDQALATVGGSTLVVPVSSNASVLAVGGRLTLTYPGRLVTLDIGLDVSGAQLRAQAPSGADGFYLEDNNGQSHPFKSSDWTAEIGLLIRWGTPELRVGGLSFLFSSFLEASYAFDWHVSPAEAGGVEDRRLNSLSVRGGIALRFRFGDLKSYY
jgi:hypothetical protein